MGCWGGEKAVYEEDVKGNEERCLRRQSPAVASPESLETALPEHAEHEKDRGSSQKANPFCNPADTLFDRVGTQFLVVLLPLIAFMLLQLTAVHCVPLPSVLPVSH